MRVADGDSSGEEPVSLAPAPEAPRDSVVSDTTPSREAGQPPQEQAYQTYGNGGALEIRRIGQWTRTGVAESRRLIIRDANAWAQFWSELGVGDRPAVDFTHNVVIAVAAGQRPTGGYEIAIAGVREQNGELTVEVLETSPGPNCMTTMSLSQPADVITVPAVDARSWSFLERKEVRGCR
jgi:hypothetical protein